MKMAFILLDGKARTNVLLSTFKEEIIDMDSIVILLSQDNELLTIEKILTDNQRLLIIYSQNIHSEHFSNARSLVHEINNNLAIIYSSIFISNKLLQKEDVNIERVSKMLVDIKSTSENMQKIVKGYAVGLEGNTVSYEMGYEDLVYYIKNTIVAYLITSKVKYTLDVLPSKEKNYKLKTIGIHLSQVIINLVKNAVESLQESDQIEKQIMLWCRIDHNALNIEVYDNGPGIPLENRESIFQNNFTTKGDKGNGIGLFFCQKFLKKSGGSLSYDDTFAEGAKFVVQLPVINIDE